jgi:hypothetical protein
VNRDVRRQVLLDQALEELEVRRAVVVDTVSREQDEVGVRRDLVERPRRLSGLPQFVGIFRVSCGCLAWSGA